MNTKTLVVVIGVLFLIAVGFVLFSYTPRHELIEAQRDARTARTELSEANEILASTQENLEKVQAELNNVSTNMLDQVEQLKNAVSVITEEKSQMLAQMQVFSQNVEELKGKLQQEQDRARLLEKQNNKLSAEKDALSQRLVGVNQKLTALENTHTTTVGHLTAMREEYVTLIKEQAELKAKLTDINALRAQMREVRKSHFSEKRKENNRIDRVERAMGNGGFLMKQGQWVSAPRRTVQYPLVQDIRRD